jgi:hypothetical protein
MAERHAIRRYTDRHELAGEFVTFTVIEHDPITGDAWYPLCDACELRDGSAHTFGEGCNTAEHAAVDASEEIDVQTAAPIILCVGCELAAGIIDEDGEPADHTLGDECELDEPQRAIMAWLMAHRVECSTTAMGCDCGAECAFCYVTHTPFEHGGNALRDATRTMRAAIGYLGGAFHPDTPAAEYQTRITDVASIRRASRSYFTPSYSAADARALDAAITLLVGAGVEVYALAFAMLGRIDGETLRATHGEHKADRHDPDALDGAKRED